MIVDLPQPLEPTNATFCPVGILKLKLENTFFSLVGYLNVKLRQSISPLISVFNLLYCLTKIREI